MAYLTDTFMRHCLNALIDPLSEWLQMQGAGKTGQFVFFSDTSQSFSGLHVTLFIVNWSLRNKLPGNSFNQNTQIYF